MPIFLVVFICFISLMFSIPSLLEGPRKLGAFLLMLGISFVVWLVAWSYADRNHISTKEFSIETVIYKNGTQEQFAFADSKKINVTSMFGMSVPENTRLEVTTYSQFTLGIWDVEKNNYTDYKLIFANERP